MITKRGIKQAIIDMVVAFLFWTIALTPYMLFIVKTNASQYVAWVSMQILIVPVLGVPYAWINRKIKLKADKNGQDRT